MSQCDVVGCGRPTSSSFSRYCNHHRSRLRRNGDVAQTGVTKTQIRPYATRVRRRIAANPGSQAWPKMEARWSDLVADSRARVAAYEAGTAMARHMVQAAQEVLRLAGEVEAREVVVTVAAMFLMLDTEPHWFKSEAAFDIQLVRRVRGLTQTSTTAYRDPKSGKARRIYHPLPPRAAAELAGWLTGSLGVLGLHIARLERTEREAKQQEDEELHAALMALK